MYVTAWTLFTAMPNWTRMPGRWNGSLMLTGEVQSNGSEPICSVYQCLSLNFLSLPLHYSMASIGFQSCLMLHSNMQAAGQSSAPHQSGVFNSDAWIKTYVCLVEIWTAEKESECFWKRKEPGLWEDGFLSHGSLVVKSKKDLTTRYVVLFYFNCDESIYTCCLPSPARPRVAHWGHAIFEWREFWGGALQDLHSGKWEQRGWAKC